MARLSGSSIHRVSVEPHASALAARGDGNLVAVVGGRRAVLLDPFELSVRPRHELTLLRPAACAAWGCLTSSASPEEAALFVGTDNGRVEGWLRKENVARKYDNSIVLGHPTAAGAAGLAAVPGRWPASGRIHALAISPHKHGAITTVENRRLHYWQIDDETVASSQTKALASSTISREPIFAMDWSPEASDTVAIGDAGSAIHLVDTRTIGQKDGTDSVFVGNYGRSSSAHSGHAIRAMTWLDGRYLASTGDDGVIKIWDVRKTDSPLSVLLRAHVGPARTITAAQNMLASGGADGRVNLWNWKTSAGGDQVNVSVNKMWNVDSLARHAQDAAGLAKFAPPSLDVESKSKSRSLATGSGFLRTLPDVAFRDADVDGRGIPESITGISVVAGLITAVSADGRLARTTVV